MFCLLSSPAAANNIRVTNVGLSKNNGTADLTANVYCDISWDNSWRDGPYRDAAWVFVKFRVQGSSVWDHAILSTNSSDHQPAANSAISAVSDGMGVFIYSATNNTGSVSYARTKLCWNYGSNGYVFAMSAPVEVSVHAIEMVYIPEGAFYLGSGGGESGHFFQYTDGSQITNPFPVSSEEAITVTNTAGNLYQDQPGGSYGDGKGIVSNAFPKGFAAFYCMKYEVSQGQYAEFLNKLTTVQASYNYPNTTLNGHTITRNATNYYYADAPDRACNYVAYGKTAAYADWAALRPMTELEFEKACRGPATPVSNEYAWGNTTVTQLSAEAGTVGSGTETVSTPVGANCLYNSGAISRPTRVGIFAARASPARQLSGGGNYGVMDLSGNVSERCITIGCSVGRGYTGLHGNGNLHSTGYADVTGWSGQSGNISGIRGGDWTYGTAQLRVSDRWMAYYEDAATLGYAGFRSVRTAP